MKKILLPVDGSKRSIRTVEMVKQLCDPADSDITVVKVVSAQLYINSMDEIKHNAEKAQPELTAVADMLPGYQVKTQVLLGSAPGVEIVEYAKESGTEMIIMTRSSRGPLRKLGSVATYIVRNAFPGCHCHAGGGRRITPPETAPLLRAKCPLYDWR